VITASGIRESVRTIENPGPVPSRPLLDELRETVKQIVDRPMSSHEACDYEMCKYREYDQDTGETVGCGLPKHGLKQRHGSWKRL
jgi:hypothetical protein